MLIKLKIVLTEKYSETITIMFKRATFLSLLSLAGFAAAEDTALTWATGTTYTASEAAVGDTVTFTYGEAHNVYIHPSGDCTEDGKIVVGTNTDSPAVYTFTEADAGTTVTFACDTGSHCEGGQTIQFTIPATDTGGDPTAAPEPTAAPADDSAATKATLAVGTVAAAVAMMM